MKRWSLSNYRTLELFRWTSLVTIFEESIIAFPPDTNIAPSEVVILIPNDDPEAFAVMYPEVSVFGTYRGHFDNGGETISLMTPFQ